MRFFLIFSSFLLSCSLVQSQSQSEDFYTYDLYEQLEDEPGDYLSTGSSPGGSGKQKLKKFTFTILLSH